MEQTYNTQYPLIFVNTLLCSQGNEVHYICTDKNCQYSCFICNQDACSKCVTNHQKCQTKNSKEALSSSIQQQRSSISLQQQKSIDKIDQIYDKMIDAISKSKIKFMESVDYFGLKQSSIQVVNCFNMEHEQSITGKLAEKVIQHEQQRNIYFHFQKNIIKMVQDIESYKQELLSEHKNLYFDKCSKQLLNLVGKEEKNICKRIDDSWQSQYSIHQYLNEGKKLNKISYLRIEYKELQGNTIPSFLNQINNLSGLNISLSNIQTITNMDSFQNLQILDLYWNKIKKIENLQKLVKLKELNLSQNLITKIENLQSQKELTFLSLRNNLIEKIQNLGHLKKLCKLQIYENKLDLITQIQYEQLRKLTSRGVKIYLKSAKLIYPRLS